MKRSFRRKLAISAIALSVLALGAIGGWQFYTSRPGYDLPYHARFMADADDRWTALGGTWEVASGSMRNDSNDRGAKLLTGSPSWKDYVVEGDAQLLGNGSVGLLARVREAEVGENSFRGYLAGVRTADNSLFIGVFDFAYHEAAKAPMPEPVRPFQWYHVKLKVEGCQIAASAWAPGIGEVKTLPLNDPDCFRSGSAGLRSNGTGGVWRNVAVLPAGATATARAQDVPSSDAATIERAVLQNEMQDRSGRRSGRAAAPAVHAQPVNTLMYLPSFGSPVASVRGSVVITRPAVFVQDSTGGVEIRFDGPSPLVIGDEVEVTGEVSLDRSNPVIRRARLRLLRAAVPISPEVVTANQLADGYFDGKFVQVEGYLRAISAAADGSMTMQLDAGTQSFRALLPAGRSRAHWQNLALGSRVRSRGVSVANARFNKAADPFVILVRSAEDLEVVAGPPWWRPSTLIAASLTGLGLIFVFNHLYLVAKHWRLRVVADERERLAHEIHDTLAQSFAGIGFQLQAIRNSMPGDAKVLAGQVDLAILMARTSHAEARRSIASLRPGLLGDGGLLPALRACAERMVENGGVTVETSSGDGGRSVPPRINDTLFRIGQEAIANSIRHACPATIRIELQRRRECICLSVEDDGGGFIADSDHPGFGLLGMRKRAESISATLTVRSTPGSGTRVEVNAPIGSRSRLGLWPRSQT